MDLSFEKGRIILKELLDLNYQAFFVGGFVRDHLLNMKANDIDITTNALPKEVQKIFPKTKATGIRYGTISVFKGKDSFEVTTFRSDKNYVNHRKPESVVFSKDILEDLKRRDFTINAFAMDYDGEILDLFEGKTDLKNKLIRAIGEADLRFNEDALRMLRAFRFVAKLDFDIEEKTFLSIQRNIELLKEISNERILMELKKICAYPYSQKALKLLEEGNMQKAFPEFSKALKLLKNTEEFNLNYIEFLALSFYLEEIDIPSYWRFSNKETAIINKVIELVTVTEKDKFNEMIIYRLGKDIPLMANSVNKVINPKNDQEDLILKIYEELPIYKTCDLAFKGQDILELTSERNAEIIGDIIDDITYQVITKQLANNYEDIKNFTMKLMENKYGKR
ncbi:MAG: CCA tRNA nucleotidyltransferase [Tenericutes bacterium]|nr:CCA tRNA nucleotidyltransferase [Mycoplasmatota bacterium]